MTTEIQKFDPPKAIEAVKNKVAQFAGLKITGIDDKEGYEKVRVALGTCVSTRTEFVATCKEARDDATRYSKYVIEQEKIGVDEIKKVEDELRAEKEKIDSEKEAIKQEKERKALEALQIRIDALFSVGFSMDAQDLRLMDESEYQKLLAEKTEAFAISEKERIENEARAKKDAEELAQFRARQAEIEAKEKAMKEAEEKAMKEKIEAEKIRLAQEQARIETEQRIKREQEEKEAQEKADQERLNKVKKYQKWLSDNGLTDENKSEFSIVKSEDGKEVTLFKKISTFTI